MSQCSACRLIPVEAVVSCAIFFLLLCGPEPANPFKNDNNSSVEIVMPTKPSGGYFLEDKLEIGLKFFLVDYIDSAQLAYGDTLIKINKAFINAYSEGTVAKYTLFLVEYGDSQLVKATVFVGDKQYNSSSYVSVGAHAPNITKNPPDSLLRKVGTPCTLWVKATGEMLDYIWHKDSTIFDTTSGDTLIIKGDTTANSGTYFCSAKNPKGIDSSQTCEVNYCTIPLITRDVRDTVVLRNTPLTFGIAARGGLLSYQWYKNGVAANLANKTTYGIPDMTEAHNGKYKCIVSNPYGADTSFEAKIECAAAPQFDADLKDTALAAGKSLVWKIRASGGALTYQWMKDTTALTGKTDSTLKFDTLSATDAGKYYCVVSNLAGKKSSDTAELIVLTVPKITKDIANSTVAPGDSVRFIIEATGGRLSYQWQKDTHDISLAKNPTYGIPQARSEHMGLYRCIVTNSQGADTSFQAMLTVADTPSVISFKQNKQHYALGDRCTLTVKANGVSLKYSWFKDDNPVSGVDTSVLVIDSMTDKRAGVYYCIIGNKAGSDTTDELTVAIVSAPEISKDLDSVYYVATHETLTLAIGTLSKGVTYKWQKVSVSTMFLSSDSAYTIDSMTSTDAGFYRCILSNAAGADTSVKTRVAILEAPAITKQPVSKLTIDEGGEGRIGIVASGQQLNYRWINTNGDSAGAGDTLHIRNAQEANSGIYLCIVKNKAGADTSDLCTLTVRVPDHKPPTLVSLTPGNGVGKIPITADSIIAQFSEPIDPHSVADSSLYIVGRSELHLRFKADTTGIILVLNSALSYGTEYTVIIRGTITDTAGNALGNNITCKFRTASDLEAYAGDSGEASFGEVVVLDGKNLGSSSLTVSYTWEQVSGPQVVLNFASSQSCMFKAPDSVTALQFRLLLSTIDDQSDWDTVCVRVYRNKERKLFVSASGNDFLNNGTRKKPYRTLFKALANSNPGEFAKDIYIANGNYSEAIALQNKVSLYGGFDSITWMPDAKGKTTISSTSTIAASGVSIMGVTLSKLVFLAARAINPGQNSVGLKMYQCSTMTIIDCSIAGDIAQPGSVGAAGADGKNGAGYGGGNGGSQVAWPGTGGRGGDGKGLPGKGGAGGAGRSGTVYGGAGGNGADGDTGANPGAGAPFAVVLSNGEYIPCNGSLGDSGLSGAGGGGEGGFWGVTGEAGGAGGGGGKGGQGGFGGGASIGSVISQCIGIRLLRNSFISNKAGDGGHGGTFGIGGTGLDPSPPNTPNYKAGTGGKGGNGRNGGGGAGGISVAILIDTTSKSTINADFQSVNTLTFGNAGIGGSCMQRTGSPADSCKLGADGVAREVFCIGCNQ